MTAHSLLAHDTLVWTEHPLCEFSPQINIHIRLLLCCNKTPKFFPRECGMRCCDLSPSADALTTSWQNGVRDVLILVSTPSRVLKMKSRVQLQRRVTYVRVVRKDHEKDQRNKGDHRHGMVTMKNVNLLSFYSPPTTSSYSTIQTSPRPCPSLFQV